MRIGLPYVEVDWPHGLRCTSCDHLFREGERYAVSPYAVTATGYPVTTCLCVNCSLGIPSERSGRGV